MVLHSFMAIQHYLKSLAEKYFKYVIHMISWQYSGVVYPFENISSESNLNKRQHDQECSSGKVYKCETCRPLVRGETEKIWYG